MANSLRNIMHDGITPQRAADKVRIANRPIGGFTQFEKRRVNAIEAPLIDGAYARTIRVHELLHANHSTPAVSRKWHPIAYNAVEDARVHNIYWPLSMPRQANRDCLAVALRDLRTIQPMAAMASADEWNVNLLVALRTMAIVSRLANRICNHDTALAIRQRLDKRITTAFGPIIAEKLAGILGMVKSRRYKAIREFTALLRDDDEPAHGNKQGDRANGQQTANPMRIVRLPMPEACNSKVKRTALSRSGARLNRSRIVRAITTGSTAGLFVRQRYLPGGTYLFDASGSMCLTDDMLNSLCRSVPAATVAYYSGRGMAADGTYGELVIYAERGRRAADIERVHGGNEVDLYAIEWLLRQPGPRTYIGDGEFCGGPEGQDIKAAALLAGAVANGKVTWYQSVSELSDILGKQTS
jgi:hypothetical protein